jgi:response regulator RpfG family c-di-GMP phosphodiesterase
LARAGTCFDPKLVEIFTNKILNRWKAGNPVFCFGLI